MTAYKVLGEDYVRAQTYGLSGAALEEKRSALKEEAAAKIAPLKEGLSPKVYEGFVQDGYTADEMLDYMAYEKEKKQKAAKAKEEADYAKQVDAYAKQSKERFEGDGFGDRLKQGLLRVGSELDVVTDYLNPLHEGKSDPATVGYLKAQEEMSQEYKDKHRTPEQQATAKGHEQEFADANGTVDTVVAGSKVLWDTVSNPKEWDMAGLVAEAVNPANFIGGGAGHVASKVASRTATKAAVGAATGAAVEGGVNAGYEYAVSKGQNKSDEDAKKAAILGGAMGVAIGVPTGAVGGVMTKSAKGAGEESATVPADTPEFKPMSAEQVKKEIALPEELANSALLKVEEVHSHSDMASDAITEISTKIKDPVLRDADIARRLPPTSVEADYTLRINDGKPVSARLAGARVREALRKSMDAGTQTVEQLDAILAKNGFDIESREAITKAYAAKDMGIYDAYVGKKYAEAELKGVNDVNGRNTQGDTAGEIGGGDKRTNGAGETAGQNEQPTNVSNDGGEYPQAEQSARPDAGRSDTQNELPQINEAMDRQPPAGYDEAGVPRGGENGMVQKQNGVRAKPTIGELKEQIASVESRGSYTAKNPNSTAYGKYQFLKSTYEEASKALGKSVEELRTPQGQELAMEWLVGKNAKALEERGIEPTAFSVYGAHQQGVAGFTRIINGKATETDIINMYNNTPRKYRTGKPTQDWLNYWRSKFPEKTEPNMPERVVKTADDALDDVQIDGYRPEQILADDIELADVARVADDALDDVTLKDDAFRERDDSGEVPGRSVGDAEDIMPLVIEENPIVKAERLRDSYETTTAEKAQLNSDAKAFASEVESDPYLSKVAASDIRMFEHPVTHAKVAGTVVSKGADSVVMRHYNAPLGKLEDVVVSTTRDKRMPSVRNVSTKAPLDVKDVKTRNQLVEHRYFDDIVAYAKGSQNKADFKPKRESVAKLKAQLEKRGLDKSEYAANPKYAKDRELTDGGYRAFSDEAEMFTQMKLDDALNIVQTQEYVRGYDDYHFADVSKMVDEALIESKTKQEVNSREAFDAVLGDDAVKLDINQEKKLIHIDDPMARHIERKKMERESLKGEALKTWKKENLDKKGKIREIGEC